MSSAWLICPARLQRVVSHEGSHVGLHEGQWPLRSASPRAPHPEKYPSKISSFRRHVTRFQAMRRDRSIFFSGMRHFFTADSQPHAQEDDSIRCSPDILPPSIPAGFLSAGMAFTPEMALPASTLQIFKGRKQVQDQHRRVSQQRRGDELYRIVWAVDA